MAKNKDYKFVGHYELDEELFRKVFVEVRKIYKKRGPMHEMGFGKVPAITTMDVAKVWVNEGHPFTCDHSEEIHANALKVSEAGRKIGALIFYITTGYIGKQQWDLPCWDEKIPMSALGISSEQLEIDPELKPPPEKPVIHKKCAPNSFGTHLAQTLNFLGMDTPVIIGVISCACVRHTVINPIGYGFKTIIPEDTVGDRIPGVIEQNLFDTEAKFVDVVPVDEVVKYLEGIDSNIYAKHERSMGR